MSLAEQVANEFGVSLRNVMLLRHSNESIKKLLATGATVEDYTFTQPADKTYDYLHPGKEPIEIVVAIVHDRVYGVYRVLGVESEGTTYSLTSEAHQRFDIERGKPSRPAKRYSMDRLPSTHVGLAVKGWEGSRSRTPVQRANGAFFHQVVTVSDTTPQETTALQAQLNEQIEAALARTPAQRKARLVVAPKMPRKVSVTSVAFLRNADVIAEVLLRAAGQCEICERAAPFVRRKDQSPYLEVHHRIRLADGGEDTVANAVAVCPNCHRREHYA